MTDQTPQDILNAAADLIERTGWTQGCSARDENDKKCGEEDPKAVCYCVYGAIAKSSQTLKYSKSLKLPFDILRDSAGITGGIISWNDHPDRTKEEVIAALRGVSND